MRRNVIEPNESPAPKYQTNAVASIRRIWKSLKQVPVHMSPPVYELAAAEIAAA